MRVSIGDIEPVSVLNQVDGDCQMNGLDYEQQNVNVLVPGQITGTTAK